MKGRERITTMVCARSFVATTACASGPSAVHAAQPLSRVKVVTYNLLADKYATGGCVCVGVCVCVWGGC